MNEVAVDRRAREEDDHAAVSGVGLPRGVGEDEEAAELREHLGVNTLGSSGGLHDGMCGIAGSLLVYVSTQRRRVWYM